jgi:hypothetical protein
MKQKRAKFDPQLAVEEIRLALRCADADLLGTQQCIGQWDMGALEGNSHSIAESREDIADALDLLKKLQRHVQKLQKQNEPKIRS